MDLIVLGRGKLFYKPFPLPKSWRVWTNTMGLGRDLFPGRVWTNTMGLGRGKKVYKMGLPAFPWKGVDNTIGFGGGNVY